MENLKKNIRGIIRDFDRLPITDEKKPRVGIVGEILVKFLPDANNHLVELLEEEGAEAVMPDLLDFMFYSFYNSNFKAEYLGKSTKAAKLCNMAVSPSASQIISIYNFSSIFSFQPDRDSL